MDHKTTSKFLSASVKTIGIKHQFTGYIEIVRQHFEGGIDSLLVDAIHVPRPLKTKVPALDFDRVLTARTEFEIECWKKWVWQTVKYIREAELTGHYRQFDNCCDSWNTECSYKELCELYKTMSLSDVIEFAKQSVDYEIKAWEPWKDIKKNEPENRPFDRNYDGPGEEDGPWAEGWGGRCGVEHRK